VTLPRPARVALLVVAGVGSVIAATWALQHFVPPPYSGYLALVVVGLVVTEIVKRQPWQRARRMFRIYLRARKRGADEAAARAHLLARLHRGAAARRRAAGTMAAAWTGDWEQERALAGIAGLLADEGKRLDAHVLEAAWNAERDRVTIPGWEALPRAFVEELRRRLDERERERLERLVAQYALLSQRFFGHVSALKADPAAGVGDFARLLQSVGNRIAKDAPGDAERAYRLSLRLRPDRNLAHAGLAILLDQTGRAGDAAREAADALGVLDDYAHTAGREPPPAEDIWPFRSPVKLRETLERIAKARS
jgi:hypothetical protein